MTGFRIGAASTKKEKLSPPQQKPTALVDAVTAPPQGFGVKSYLHQFYLSPTVEDIEQSGAWYLLPPPPSHRRGLLLCRICTCIGLLLLIGGAVSIVVGYTWPHEGIEDAIEKIIIYEADDGSFFVPQEKLRDLLKDPMRHWKTTGFCVFAGGAVLLAVSLIVPTIAQCVGARQLQGFASEENTPHEPPVRVFPRMEGSGPVPAASEVSHVQPGEAAAIPAAATLIDQ